MKKMKFGIGEVAVCTMAGMLIGAGLMVLGCRHCNKKVGVK